MKDYFDTPDKICVDEFNKKFIKQENENNATYKTKLWNHMSPQIIYIALENLEKNEEKIEELDIFVNFCKNIKQSVEDYCKNNEITFEKKFN